MPNLNTTDFLRTTGSAGLVTIPEVDQAVYNRTTLERSYPYLMHERFGKQYPLSRRSGKSMVFRRYERRAQATTPLSEGVTPPGTTLFHTDYRADIEQYGNFTVISDMVDYTHVDPLITEAAELMGENMGETMDSICREPLVAGTNVLMVAEDATASGAEWVAAGSLSAVAGTLNKGVLDAAIDKLKNKDAKFFTPRIPGSVRVNTFPVGKAFWMLIHSDIEHDLFNAAHSGLVVAEQFTPVERYSGFTGVMENEIGKYRNIRFVTSTNAKIRPAAGASVASGQAAEGMKGTGNADVYECLLFARDAYGVVPLERGSFKTIIERAGGNSDPLRQRNTVGWKAAGTSVILNDEWMLRISVTSLA